MVAAASGAVSATLPADKVSLIRAALVAYGTTTKIRTFGASMSVLRDFARKLCNLDGDQGRADRSYMEIVRTPVSKQQLAERVLVVFNKHFVVGPPQPAVGQGLPVPLPVPGIRPKAAVTQPASAQLILKPGELEKVRSFLKSHRDAQ